MVCKWFLGLSFNSAYYFGICPTCKVPKTTKTDTEGGYQIVVCVMDGPNQRDRAKLAGPGERVVTVCESGIGSEANNLEAYIVTSLFLANHNKNLGRKRKQPED